MQQRDHPGVSLASAGDLDWSRISVLVAAPEMPEPERQSGSRHLYQEVALLKELGAEVTVVYMYEGRPHDRILLEQMGAPVFPFSELPALLSAGDFDVALLAFWNFAEQCIPTIRERSPNTKVLIDSIDLHFVRRAREELQVTSFSQLKDGDARFGAEMRRELNAYAQADLVLTVSEQEAKMVNDLLTDPGHAIWVPLWEDFPMSNRPFEERSGSLFIGNFRHPPNEQALEWLCTEIIPRLDRGTLRHNPVTVVGNALEGRTLALCRKTDGVRPVGFVPSLLPYFNGSRLFIAPLLIGAGTKRKLIQAAMVGVPTIATSVAAEGLDIVDGEGVLIADDAETFAEGIDSHVTDAELWASLARRGRDRIVRSNGPEIARRQLTEAFRRVVRED